MALLLARRLIQAAAILFGVALITFLHVVVGELAPKTIEPHAVSFFITVLSRASCSDRDVSKIEVTMSRNDSVCSAARRAWS